MIICPACHNEVESGREHTHPALEAIRMIESNLRDFAPVQRLKNE